MFGDDFGLFISTLFRFYQFSTAKIKKTFLHDLVLKILLRFEKELVMSLSGFLMFLIPALEDNVPENQHLAYLILDKTEKFVGTSKLYGEIWKTVLRTPRARLPALKHILTKKLPKNIDEMVSLNDGTVNNSNAAKATKIFPSKYNLVIRQGQLIVGFLKSYPEELSSDELEEYPDWYRKEIKYIQKVKRAAGKNLEKLKRDKIADAKKLRTAEELTIENCSLEESLEKEREKVLEAYQYFYYPNRANLVVNALLVGLSSFDDQLVRRATFDFLKSHIDIESLDFMSREEKVRLIEVALLNMKIND